MSEANIKIATLLNRRFAAPAFGGFNRVAKNIVARPWTYSLFFCKRPKILTKNRVRSQLCTGSDFQLNNKLFLPDFAAGDDKDI